MRAAHVVKWAGNPHKPDGANTTVPLTPRNSFDAWREIVRGRALPWTLPEFDAATRLRAALLEVQQNRRILDLNQQLTETVQSKDLLLQDNKFLIGEINHRVQNSLQLVSHYLELQGRKSDNPDVSAALEEARRRIIAVSLVHRRLYRGNQSDLVDVARYIEDLCTDTLPFMGEDWAQHFSMKLATGVMISTDRAVTLGLLLTELLINANKYAYGAAGPIDIGLTKDGTLLHFTVADKGAGMISYSKGFSPRIVQGLASQIGGKLDYSHNNPGLRAVVTVSIT